MSVQHEITLTWSRNGSSPVSNTVTKAAGKEVNLDEPIPGASTNYQINVNLDVSELVSLYLVCDKDCTIKTNDSSTPDDTLTLKAGEPLVFYEGGSFPNPFTSGTDVTAFFVTMADPNGATLQMFALVDPTP